MANSRIEEARDLIAYNLGLITTGNNYRNTVANVSKAIVSPGILSEWPHVCVELGDSVLEMQTDKRDVFHELTQVFIVAFVKADSEATLDVDDTSELMDAMESMVHDLKRNLGQILTTYITSKSNPWNIELSENKLSFTRSRFLGEGRNLGVIETSFTVKVRNQNFEFNEFLLEEDSDEIETEASVRIET